MPVPEFGVTWTIVGYDGTTLTLPDVTNGVVLEALSGFDGANIRESIEDIPADDGSRVGNFYYGSRPMTLQGKVGVNVTAATRNAAIVTLQQAFRGLLGDLTLKWTPSGMAAVQIGARTQQPPRLTGGFVKDWIVGLVAYDPRIYTQAQHTTTITASSATVCTGTVTNAGNFRTPPVITVTGPTNANSQINGPAGAIIKWNTALTAGQTLVIDMAARTATRSGAVNWYDKIVFPASSWWQLVAGAQTVSMTGGGFTSGTTKLDIVFRDAWL